MSERFPIQNKVEEAISKQVDSLVGCKDTNLNTILKMTLLGGVDCIDDEEVKKVLSNILDANIKEARMIADEFQLGLDESGDIVFLNGIDEHERKKSEEDPGGVLPQSGGGESKIE